MAPDRRRYLATQYGWTPEQVDVIRNAICVSATDEELEFFLATTKRLDLDPFARQIWFVKRRQKRTDARGTDEWVDVGRPETGIDGYRTIAERSGVWEGQEPTLWCGTDGRWSEVWLEDVPPHACKITLYRKDRRPVVAVGLFREYCPVYKGKNGSFVPEMWQKRASGQLEKCTEALAFRRAFPRDLSGIRIDTEMEHVDAQAPSAEGYSAPAKATSSSSAVVHIAPKTEAAKIADTDNYQAQPATIADIEPTTTTRASIEEPGDEEAVLRVVARMLEVIDASTSREAMGASVGPALTKAKDDMRNPTPSLLSQTITRDVVPAFQAKYRSLQPTTKGKR